MASLRLSWFPCGQSVSIFRVQLDRMARAFGGARFALTGSPETALP